MAAALRSLTPLTPSGRLAPSWLFLILLVWTALPSPAQANDIAALADQYLSKRSEMGNFSGAVLIARGGKVVLRKGYGYANVEDRVPYTPETRHEVASISKMFTSMAALKLRDRGNLRLEDSICKYLEDCPETWKPVTVQHLMRNASGIPDYEEPLGLGSEKYFELMTRPEATATIFENAKKLPLDFKPGEKLSYSNTGYIVLSHVVQKAAGQPFAEFMTNGILKPAGMKSSGVLGFGAPPKNLAHGYTYGDIGWEKTLAGAPLTAGHLKRQPQLPLTPPAGDGGLYSTVEDLYRWSLIMDGSRFVSKQEAAEVFTPGLGDYGYGWFIDAELDRRRMNHTGSLPGYTSVFTKFPDDRVTIIIFSNLDRARMRSINRDVTAMVLGKPFDMPVSGKVIKLAVEQIARLEGDYKTTDGKLLKVRNEPDFLTAELEGRYTAGLIPLSPTEFYFPLADGKAIFTLDDNGRATKVNMRYNGEDHIATRIDQQ